MADSINVEIQKDTTGEVRSASIRFGPHHRVEVQRQGDSISFVLVATHHGFRADASEVGGELYQLIEEVRRVRPEMTVD